MKKRTHMHKRTLDLHGKPNEGKQLWELTHNIKDHYQKGLTN